MEKNENTEKPEHGHGHEHGHEHDDELVTITVDTKPYKIRHGQQTVVAIKQLAGVPLAYELEQLIAGKLTPLPDEASVTIKGGEVFLSHPKDGGAS
jgi:hypothetical protein